MTTSAHHSQSPHTPNGCLHLLLILIALLFVLCQPEQRKEVDDENA